MIRFFRRIRRKLANENQFIKYTRYAVGEILLVVVGILIALNVNNWNERNKQEKEINNYTKFLITDLEGDISEINIRLNQCEKIINRIDSLTFYLQGKKIENISNLDVLCLSWSVMYRPYQWNRTTIENLKSSDGAKLVLDDSLTNKIFEYDAFTHHLDEDYNTDRGNSEKAKQLMSHVIKTNYINYKELHESLRLYANSLGSFDFFELPPYQIAKSQSLNLITNDINDINEAINSFINLQLTLMARKNIEYPKLIKDAELLISSLKETF